MKVIKQNPSYIFFTGITMVLVSLLAMQLIIIFNQQALAAQISLPVESEFLIIPTETGVIDTLITSTPIVTPTVESSPKKVEPLETKLTNLRFGVTKRALNCTLMTKIVALVLEEQEKIKIEMVEYEEPAQLYEALASTVETEKIDLTLCFLDPDDRPYIRKYFGFTTQLGTAYWQDESSKFLIMANASVVAPLKKNQSCIYNFFEKISFEESPSEQDAATWIDNHSSTVRSWTNCNPK